MASSLPPYPQTSPGEEFRAAAFAATFFISLFGGAFLLGMMIRREISPWAWQQIPLDVGRHGLGDGVFLAVCYLVFYFSLFFFPYCVLHFAFWLAYMQNLGTSRQPMDQAGIRFGVAEIAFAFGLVLLCLLSPVLGFLRGLPVDVWDGGFLILLAALFAVLLFAGIVTLRHEIAKTRVVLPYDSFLLNECSKCGHSWVRPAKDHEERWFRDPWADATSRAGGYPIE